MHGSDVQDHNEEVQGYEWHLQTGQHGRHGQAGEDDGLVSHAYCDLS